MGQILSVLWLMADYRYPEQLTEFGTVHQADLLIKSEAVLQLKPTTSLLKLKTSELETALALLFEVNAAFFSKDEEKNAKENEWGGRLFIDSENITGREFYKQLSSNAEIITRQGHPNVLDYPFSYFLTVLDNINEANSG